VAWVASFDWGYGCLRMDYGLRWQHVNRNTVPADCCELTGPTQNGSLEVFCYHHVFQMNGQTYTLTGATSPAAVPGALQLGLELRPGGMAMRGSIS